MSDANRYALKGKIEKIRCVLRLLSHSANFTENAQCVNPTAITTITVIHLAFLLYRSIIARSTGGDLASTRVTKFLVHVEDVAHLVNNAANL